MEFSGPKSAEPESDTASRVASSYTLIKEVFECSLITGARSGIYTPTRHSTEHKGRDFNTWVGYAITFTRFLIHFSPLPIPNFTGETSQQLIFSLLEEI